MFYPEIDSIKQQILNKFCPENLYLFGSYARGLARKNSDIDICVIIDSDDKRKLREKILLEVESEKDIDVVIYTPKEWMRYKDDPSKFCYLIAQKGVSLIG